MDFKGIIYGGNKADVNDQHARDMITDAFMEGKAYHAGELCIYNNSLYKFTTDKNTGPWNDTVAKKTTLADVYSELNGNFVEFQSSVPTSGYEILPDSYIRKNMFGEVDLFLNIRASTVINSMHTIAYVPEGFRPAGGYIAVVANIVSAGVNPEQIPAFVYKGGEIKVQNAKSNATYQIQLGAHYSTI